METSFFNSTDYFAGINDVKKIKKHWVRLVKTYHPYAGGSVDKMQEINYQYLNWQNINNSKYTEQQSDRDIADLIKILKKTFSNPAWQTFFRHPEIHYVMNEISKKRIQKIK